MIETTRFKQHLLSPIMKGSLGKNLLPLLALMFQLLKECLGSGRLSIQLMSYKNPNHVVYNGECCDTQFWCRRNQCENYFKFCVTALESTNQCSLGSATTGVLGDDDFRFPGLGGSLGNGHTNPLTYSFTKWKGAIIAVEVWDNDAEHIIGKLHDFVDKYSLSFKNGADVGKDRATSHSHTFRGRRSHMEVTLKVFCDVNYLIPDCQSYCAPRNNTDGHFTCDYAAGVKLCLDGWYDPGTDCVKKKKFCVPLNSTLGHYECNPVSGEKICLPGWDGANCTELWKPTPSIYVPPTSTLLLPTSPAPSGSTTSYQTTSPASSSSSNVYQTSSSTPNGYSTIGKATPNGSYTTYQTTSSTPSGYSTIVKATSSTPSGSSAIYQTTSPALSGSSNVYQTTSSTQSSSSAIYQTTSSVPSDYSTIVKATSSTSIGSSTTYQTTSSVPSDYSTIVKATSSTSIGSSAIYQTTSSVPNDYSTIVKATSSTPNDYSTIVKATSSTPSGSSTSYQTTSPASSGSSTVYQTSFSTPSGYSNTLLSHETKTSLYSSITQLSTEISSKGPAVTQAHSTLSVATHSSASAHHSSNIPSSTSTSKESEISTRRLETTSSTTEIFTSWHSHKTKSDESSLVISDLVTTSLPFAMETKIVSSSHSLRMSLIMTSALIVSTSSHAPSTHLVHSTPVLTTSRPRGTDAVAIDIKPGHNWTDTKEEKLKTIIANQLNEVCGLDPTSCSINSTGLDSRIKFNSSNVIMKLVNDSDGEVSLVVQVKLPDKVPVIIGGAGVVTSQVLKEVIEKLKPVIEKETGTTVVSVREVTFPTGTDGPTHPTTETPRSPGVQRVSLMLYLLVAAGLTLFVFILMLALWIFHRRIRNKVQKIHLLPESRREPVQDEELLTFSRSNSRLSMGSISAESLPLNRPSNMAAALFD